MARVGLGGGEDIESVQAASITISIARTTSLPDLSREDLRVLVKGVSLLERCHLHLAADVPRRAGDRRRERHRDAECAAGHPDAQRPCLLAVLRYWSLGGLNRNDAGVPVSTATGRGDA